MATKSSKKITYTATFADGSIKTRKSERTYRFAWRCTCEWNNAKTGKSGSYTTEGFAATRELADKAARGDVWSPAEAKRLGLENTVSIEIVEVVGA